MGIFKKKNYFIKFGKDFKEEIKQLEELGYYKAQIKEILVTACLDGKGSLSIKEKEAIRANLNEHIEFAKKVLISNDIN